MSGLPFSQACENNKKPILEILQRHLQGKLKVLEIGGGTGQHAVFFSDALPELHWQSSDIPDYVNTLNLRIAAADKEQLPAALCLDVNGDWPTQKYDAVYSANSLHIMSRDSVQEFFKGVGKLLEKGGLLLVYGPCKYQGKFTTESNASFDEWLKARDPVSGVRDFEWLDDLAREQKLELLEDNAMPANNQLLVWRKTAD